MDQKEFKVGDEVYVVYHGWNSDRASYELTKILSISPKRGDIKVANFTTLFDPRGNSKSRADRWSPGPTLVHATPELKAEIRAKNRLQRALNYVEGFDFKVMSLEDLEAIGQIIKKYPEKKET